MRAKAENEEKRDGTTSVLIVEDDKNLSKSLSLILTRKGFHVGTAGTGEEALKEVRERFFNVVLLDVGLPDSLGVELILPLRKLQPKMEVIMITGQASLDTAVRALNEGASAFVTKPPDMDTVLARIGQIVENQNLVSENRKLFQEAQQEIEERKRAEAILSESEEKYRLLFSNMLNGFALHEVVVDEEGRPCDYIFLEANNAFEALTGLKRADIVGRRVTEVLPGIKDDPADWIGKYGNVALTGEPIRFEQYAEQLETWFSIYAFRSKPNQFAVIFEDITKRKKATEALSESEELFRLALGNSPITVFRQDRDLRYTWAYNPSPAFEPGSLLGKTDADILPPGQAVAPMELKRRVLETGESARGEFFFSAGAETLFYDVQVTPDRGASGEVMGVVCVSVDITERKVMEGQLQQAQKMEAVGTLAGGIAHNFNNLLQVIMGNASKLAEETDPGHPHQRVLSTIMNRVRSGSELTSQLLGFARGGKYHPKLINPNTLMVNTINFIGRSHKEIEIQPELAEKLWNAKIDEGQIEQVLLNLFVNAWQAMPRGGRIFVKSENVTIDSSFANLHEAAPGRFVKISIRDTGTGIEPDIRDRIFEPFFTTKEIGRGSGLGLASAYGIIKNHEGIITFESEVGEGSTFYIYLPANDEEITPVKETAKIEREGTGTILFVDDEEDVVEVGRQMLIILGYQVMVAGSGGKALEIYRENMDKIDLVITDMIMPGMGGGELFDTLKELNPRVKVLLSSGYSLEGQGKDIMDRGCNGFIPKPFDLETLSRLIHGVLDN